MGSVLDEFQTHRPLIACTVIGLILGDLKTGIILGGTLELIALGWMNVGAAQSPDSALASIISAILVIVGQQSIATGIAIALPVAAAGQVLTVFARTITVVFQHAADKAAEEARFRTLDILHVSALGVQALRVAIPALIVSLFVSADMVSNMLSAIPEFVTRGLQIAGGFIVVRVACDAFKILEIISQNEDDISPAITAVSENPARYGTSQDEPPSITSKAEIERTVSRVLTENNDHGKNTTLSEIGSILQKKFSEFDVRNYGYSKLSTFLESMNDIEVLKTGHNYLVKERQNTVSRQQIEKCITDLICSNGGHIDNLSIIHDALRNRFPGFDVKQYGYSRISSFINSFKKFKITNNTVCRSLLPARRAPPARPPRCWQNRRSHPGKR